MPNLLEIQKTSYQEFLDTGLREVFADVGAISDYQGNLELTFIDYKMDEAPKYDVEECKARDATYAAPLKVRVRLRNKETEEIKEQEIFMGDFPIMTPSGTFVINGAERVIVSQIVRSPGVYYDKKTDKAYNSTYGTTVIPYHGAWLEYETDLNDIFNCRIDKNRKLPVTWFIKAMGAYKADNPNTWLSCIPDMTTGVVTNEQIKEVFDNDARIVATLDKDTCNSREEALVEIYRKLRPGDPPTVESSETLLEGLFYDRRRYAGVPRRQAGQSGCGCPPQGRCAGSAGLKEKNRAVWPLPVFQWAAAFLYLTIWHICHILKGEKCREDFEMGPFVVEFYETRDGQRPAEDFLDELDIKMRSKLVMTLKVLQEQGNRLREPYSKHLDDGIFEIRGKVGTDISRVMYFFYYGGRIILTNGFIKKTQKTPKSEIERAKQYRKDFLEREGESDENTGSVFE